MKNPFSTFANFRKKSSPTLATAPNGASNPMYGESGEPSSKAVANPTNNGVVPTATAKSPPASSPPPVPDKRLDLPRFPGFAVSTFCCIANYISHFEKREISCSLYCVPMAMTNM